MIPPRIVVSACLTGEKTRYNGEVLQCELIRRLLPHAQIIVVCPEISIGLPVPRNPINIIKKKGEYRAIEETTNKDLTPALLKFSSSFLKKVPSVDGFLLKSRSPSCGYSGTKVYADETKKVLLGRERGIFAREIRKRLPSTPIEDEERLSHFFIRHNYFIKIFIISKLRAMEKDTSIASLFDYHKRIRTILYSYNPLALKNLDKLFNPPSSAIEWKNYFHRVQSILAHTPGISSFFDSLLRFYGPTIKELDSDLYKEILSKTQKEEEFKEILKKIRSLAIQKEPSLQRELFFFPYPEELFY